MPQLIEHICSCSFCSRRWAKGIFLLFSHPWERRAPQEKGIWGAESCTTSTTEKRSPHMREVCVIQCDCGGGGCTEWDEEMGAPNEILLMGVRGERERDEEKKNFLPTFLVGNNQGGRFSTPLLLLLLQLRFSIIHLRPLNKIGRIKFIHCSLMGSSRDHAGQDKKGSNFRFRQHGDLRV